MADVATNLNTIQRYFKFSDFTSCDVDSFNEIINLFDE